MKALLFVILSAIFECVSLKCYAQESGEQQRQGWDRAFPIYGDVVSVTREEYTLDDVMGQHVRGDNPLSTVIYTFNRLGDVEEWSRYASNGVLEEKCLYTYSSANQMLDKSLYGESRMLSFKTIYKYDEDGQLTEVTEYNNNAQIVSQENYTYYSDGELEDCVKKESVRYHNGKKSFRVEIIDNEGDVLMVEYVKNGKPHREWSEYTYDEDGCVSEVVSLDDDDNLVRKDVREYNDSKCLTTRLIYNSKGEPSRKYEYKYDSFNNVVEAREYRTAILLPNKLVEYSYDYRSNIVIVDADASGEEPVYLSVEGMPTFEGGDLDAFRAWFARESEILPMAVKKIVESEMAVQFVIEKDGSVSNIEFMQSPHISYEDDVREVLMRSPKWTPGCRGGVAVRVKYFLTMDYLLQCE